MPDNNCWIKCPAAVAAWIKNVTPPPPFALTSAYGLEIEVTA
jgi:hypothetical protein